MCLAIFKDCYVSVEDHAQKNINGKRLLSIYYSTYCNVSTMQYVSRRSLNYFSLETYVQVRVLSNM